MNDSSLWWLPILVNHLWQSTLFAVAIGGLTLLLRRNSARVRYWLWLAASLKFLLPFASLAAIGTYIPWRPEIGDQGAAAPQVLAFAGTFSAPMAFEISFPGLPTGGTSNGTDGSLLVLVMFFAWATGAAVVLARWLSRWLEIRRVLRKSEVVTGIDFPVRVRATAKQFEPGIVGVFRPALLLPKGIEERLTREQMQAVLAHERCHLRWRDNTTASQHMLVETVFWFYPLVWWIGARLIEERERDCDEQVVRDGHAPESYAEGILAVCEHYIASRLPCVSGVSGSDLRKRIERIVKRTLAVKLDGPKKLILAAVVCCTVAAPIAAGVIAGSTWGVLFSLKPSTAAMLEYFQLGSAMDNLMISGMTGRDFSTFTCPAPSQIVVQQQKVLAATVAKLSPADGEKALLYAVAANSTANVQRLLAEDAPRNGDGFLRPNSLMHIAAQFSDVPMLELLAGAGFDIDGWGGPFGREGNGFAASTPLMTAISSGRWRNAYWFIQHGADVNATNAAGNSALFHAMVNCRDRALVMQLLRSGARPNAKALRIAKSMGFDLGTDGTVPGLATGWRAQSKQVEAKADFDGDGEEDQAALYLSADGRKEGLFVKLSSRDPDKWIQAAETLSTQSLTIPSMGIAVVKPGTYATACAKGYGKPCEAGEPVALKLEHSGIDFLMPESATSIVYWDSTVDAFKRVWISD